MAKASQKQIDSSNRLRYIRVLERFSKSIIIYLSKSDQVSREVFDTKVDNNLKYLNRVESVQLYKGEFSDLESLVKDILAFRNSDSLIENIRDELTYKANQLEKSTNARSYRKDKHKNQKFDEWS
jgi:hypothetical protein